MGLKEGAVRPGGHDAARTRVRSYWESAHDLYLAHVGTSFQAGRITAGRSMRDSNVWLARAAGLRRGLRVLDAGCGVCGPAIDMAQEIPGLCVVGITLVGRQATAARALVATSGLSGRVHVVQADFHAAPFAAGSFDAVLFLESLGYAADLEQVLGGAGRVLRPGGTLYVKDVFRRVPLYSDEERRELAAFDRAFAIRTPTLDACTAAAAAAGFGRIATRDLTGIVSTAHARRAMVDAAGVETPFGRRHRLHLSCLPVYFAELTAIKPPASGRGGEPCHAGQ